MSILGFGFLSPWLMAAGAAATSIPIIIHLLNKRKFRVVVWAAMDWLLAAQRRNARRLRFQRWLLLAIRCLALLVIAAGIAQLVLQSKSFGEIFGGEQRAVVILWDDSYSMGYQPGGAGGGGLSAFDRSKRLITDYLGRLKASDKVLLIRASRLAAAEPGDPTLDHAAVAAQVSGAAVTDAGTNLPGAMEKAAAALKKIEATTRVRQVLLLTDFSNSSIHDPVRGVGAENRVQGLEGDRIRKAADALRAHATDFRVVDVGDPGQVNLAVTQLRSKRPAVVAGAAGAFDVTVFNGTDRAQQDLPLTVLIDGVPQQTQKLPRIEPGTPLTIALRATISTPGRHLVEARLPADDLPVDDDRRLLVDVLHDIPVLLVDGNPGDGKTTFGSTAYLWAAYALTQGEGGTSASMFAPRTITELELPTTPLSGFAVVALSDVTDPPPAVRDNLRKFVEEGGLLMVFPGPRTNSMAARFNESLGEGAGSGARLLPATLGTMVNLEGNPAGGAGEVEGAGNGAAFAPEGYGHPVLSVFAADTRAGKDVGFTTVQTARYLKLGVPAGSDTETVLRYANRDGSPGDPAVVMKGVGKGKVVLFASTADMTWNTWGAKPSFLPFIHELTFYGMSRDLAGGKYTLNLGDRIRLPADAAAAGSWNAPRDTRVAVTSELTREGQAVLTSPPLLLAGTYAPAETAGGAGGGSRAVIAVNADAEEADIRHVTAGQMAAALGIQPGLILERPAALAVMAAAQANDDAGSILGIGLVGTALGLFVLETVLAMLFSTYR